MADAANKFKKLCVDLKNETSDVTQYKEKFLI